jgi:hypothetical protein
MSTIQYCYQTVNDDCSDDSTCCAEYLKTSPCCTYQQSNKKACKKNAVKNNLCSLHLHQYTEKIEEQCTFIQKNGKCLQKIASNGLCCLHSSQISRNMVKSEGKTFELPTLINVTKNTLPLLQIAGTTLKNVENNTLPLQSVKELPALINVTKKTLIIEQINYDCLQKFEVGDITFSFQFVFMNMNFDLKIMNGLYGKLKSSIEQDFSRLQFGKLDNDGKDFLAIYLMSIAYNSEGYITPKDLFCQYLVSEISENKRAVNIVFSPWFKN